LGSAVSVVDGDALDVERQCAGGLGAGEHHMMPGAVVEAGRGVDRGVGVAGAGPAATAVEPHFQAEVVADVALTGLTTNQLGASSIPVGQIAGRARVATHESR
jgi:hypothetical protein